MKVDCAVCLIRDGRNFLIAQRSDDDRFGGYWEFPGGKCEPRESLEDCARREALEEVGLEVEVGDLLLTVENPYPGSPIRLHFFLCRSARGDAKPLECQAVRWVDVRELDKILFPPANAAVIARLVVQLDEPAGRP